MNRAVAIALSCLVLSAAPRPQEAELVLNHFSQRGGYSAGLFVSGSGKALRVLNGGALTSAARPSPALLADILESAAFDAIAVGYEDLARATGTMRGLLAAPGLPWVCANVKGAGKSHVVRKAGRLRVAFVGVTQPPAYKRVDLPEGWTIEDPGAALKALLPELGKSADVVVLLAIMDRIECADLVRNLPGIHMALVPAFGGSDAEPLQVGSTLLLQSPTGSEVLGHLSLKLDGNKIAASSHRLEAAVASEADHTRARAMFAKHKVDMVPGGLASSAPAAKETGPLTSLKPGEAQPVIVLRSEPSVEIQIESLQEVGERNGKRPPPGSAWLVIRSAWKNLIPMTSAGDRQVPTAYSVGDAANNLYVVVNGKRLSLLESELSGGPDGLLNGRSISIASTGDVRRGDLVYAIPASGLETLDLHFHDFRKKPMVFPLLARPPGRNVDEKPVAPLAKNEILEIGVFNVRREAGLGERKAPEGMTYLLLDFRARSTVTLEIDKVQVGVAGDLPEIWKSLTVTADGGRSFTPCEGTELPQAPRFLPDALTGGRVAYLIPEKAGSLALRCEFGEIGLPDGRQLKPRVLAFVLDGRMRACPKCKRDAAADDKFCADCGTKIGP